MGLLIKTSAWILLGHVSIFRQVYDFSQNIFAIFFLPIMGRRATLNLRILDKRKKIIFGLFSQTNKISPFDEAIFEVIHYNSSPFFI